MYVRGSTIFNEIVAIANDGAKPVHFVWKCEFMVQGVRYEPFRTLDIEILRDYAENYAEDIEVKIMVLPSQYLDYIYPNRANLTVSLYQIPLNEDGSENWEVPRVVEVYRGYIKGAKDLKLNASVEIGSSEDTDMMGPIPVHIQLSSRALEQLRLEIVGGIFENKSPATVLRALFDRVSAKIKVDSTQVITGTDMVPPDNTAPRKVLVIPHGKLLVELPKYLQNQGGGIYNSDIHFFLQGDRWYIWPKYATDRQEKVKRVLTIFDIPANQFPGIERTYRETEGQVIVISTGKSANQDTGEYIDLNVGNGVRFTNAGSVLNDMVEVNGDKVTARRAVANSEFLDASRENGVNFAPMSGERITDNPFKMTSKIAARKGMVMMFTWENANPFLLYPGMPVKVYTLRDNVLEERTGVLSFSQYHIFSKSKTIRDSRQACAATLAVFLSRTPVS